MKINGREYNVDDLVKINNSSILKDVGGGMLLSEEQISVLNKYNIDYRKYTNIKELLYEIELIINDEFNSIEIDDLEWVSQNLAETSYYEYTNK